MLRMFRAAVKLSPRSWHLRKDLAEFLNSIQRSREALKILTTLHEERPYDFHVINSLGVAYAEVGEHMKGRQLFKKALDLMNRRMVDGNARPDAIWAVANLAKLVGKVDEAEKILKKTIDVDRKTDMVVCSFQALGDLYYSVEKFDKAQQALKKGAELEPKNPRSQFQAAILTYLTGDYANARRYIDRILTDRREHVHEAMVVKGYLLLLERKRKEAAQMFQAARARNNEGQGVAVGLGHLAIQERDYPNANSYLRPVAEALQRKEDLRSDKYLFLCYQMASLGLGWLHANQNRHEDALRHFDHMLVLNPSSVFALLGKGNSLNALGRLNEAEKVLRRVLHIRPDNQYAYAELGLVKLNKGEVQEAERAFVKARAKGGEQYTCPYEGLGLVYLKKGKIDMAAASFRKAITINPNIEYKKYNELAKIFIKKGEVRRAATLLGKSIKNYRYDPEAANLLAQLRRRMKTDRAQTTQGPLAGP